MSAPTDARAERPATRTFVFTDIEGSTRLLEELRERYADVLARHGDLIRQAALGTGGEVVDTQGDAFFLAFRSSTQAVAFAADAQRVLERERWPGDKRLRVRMGVHAGEAARTATGYVGLDVHLAARISSVGHGGQVLVSGAAAEMFERGDDTRLRSLGEHHLKDFARPVVLHQLIIDGLQSDFPPPRSVDEPDQPPAPGAPPFQGLAHYDEADAERFFGREKVVERLLGRMAKHPFLAVIGASGSGKSSVVRAGLVPALRRQGMSKVVVLTPTAEPFTALAAALEPDSETHRLDELAQVLRASPMALVERLGQGSLLVVDQVEELFSLCRDEEERAAFIERLLSAAEGGGHVVLTLRADFYDRLAGYPALRDAVAAHQEYLGQMSTEELRRAITGPAEAGGWRFDAGLVDLILHDVGTEPGALPLLSHALLETWHRRRGRLMMLRGYLESGGVQGAIARSADRLMAELEPGQQDIARAIFLRLTEFGAGTPDTRRRAALEELLGQSNSEQASVVLQRLADRRLVVLGSDTAEVAHEALIREWPTLREWLASDREALRLHRSLTEAAAEWQRSGQDPSLLFRGARLAAALDWATEHDAEPNASEREFLEESRSASEREAQRQRQVNRRLRFLLAGTAVFLILAIAAGAYALLEAGRAEREAALARQEAARAELGEERAAQEAERADEQRLTARSRELTASAVAFGREDPPLAKLLALVAATMIPDPSLETIAALHQAWAADRMVGSYSWPDDRETGEPWADLHPAGELMVAGNWQYFEVLERESGRVLWSREVEDGLDQWRPVFDPTGDMVAVGVALVTAPENISDPGAPGMYLLEARTGRQVARFEAGACGGGILGASSTHLLVDRLQESPPADCWDDDDIRPELHLVEIASGDWTFVTRDHADLASLSADGTRLAYDDFSEGHQSGVVVDVASGQELLRLDTREIDQQDSHVHELNADGTLLLYGGRPVHVYDVDSGELAGIYTGHAGETWQARFGHDRETVFSAGRDATLHRWNAHSGQALDVYRGVGTGRIGLSDTGLLTVVDPDRSATWILDAGLGGQAGFVETCGQGFVFAQTLSVVGSVAALAQQCGAGNASYVADMATQRVTMTIADHTAQGLALSPDGRRVLRQTGGQDVGPLEIIDLSDGSALELDGMCTWADNPAEQEGCRAWPEVPFPLWNWRLAWSPDGRMVAAVDDVGRLFGGPGRSFAVWDAATGGLLFLGPRGLGSNDVLFAPDSSGLLVSLGDAPPSVAVLSTTTWQIEREVELGAVVGGVTFIGYSGDGRNLIGITGIGLGGGGSLVWMDAAELAVDREIDRIHDGSPKSSALSPSGSHIATGSSDGYVRVWDVERRALVHEFRIGDEQVQGVAFVSDSHLAVAPETGHIFIYTIDQAELIEIVRRSLTRGFTGLECERFNFGEACPSLDELRGP